ncbi:MAG TPA: hypothetical protein VN894_06095 [Polyangiaceae bacterium]|nr:hypothetical protein [Polyangiaceae bacterium]
MFIVAMTLAVLGSVGIFALAAAATEVRTSGNERQNTQTHYMAEYGIIGASHEITGAAVKWQLGVMLDPLNRDGLKPGSTGAPCLALQNVPATADAMTLACRRMGAAELGAAWAPTPITVPYASTTPLMANVNPGSLGPIPMSGDFFVELTDPWKANTPARYALDLNFCFIELTVTAGGITQPVFTNNTAQAAGEGIEVQRARLIAGPIQCPK